MDSPGTFTRLAKRMSHMMGRPGAFLLAVASIFAWAVTGPLFGFSNTWQLVVNTATTIITFLMVFLIQNTQNRDTAALQLKIDELIRAQKGAHNSLLDLEELTDAEIDWFKQQYDRLAQQARRDLQNGRLDTDQPTVSGPPETEKARANDPGLR